jgi:hypothetical protein
MNARLLIVTDLGLLQAYRLELREESSPRITLMERFVFEPAHLHMTERITDSAGRRARPAGKMGGGTMADTHNLKLETRRRLVRQIAQTIDDLANAHGPDGFWLAAQREILRPVLELLSHRARNRIEKKVPRDLTKLRPKEVLAYFLPKPKARR